MLLHDRSLGMIFEEPSTRTRVSFEVAMAKLGGHALYLKPGEIHLGARESLYDTAKVLSRMCDVIEARTLKHETVLELATDSDVPVINGLTDYNHPTQVVCDLLTMSEHLPEGKRLDECTVVFVGDRTNVCSSLMAITTQFGMDFIHAAPAAYQSPPEWIAIARGERGALGRLGHGHRGRRGRCRARPTSSTRTSGGGSTRRTRSPSAAPRSCRAIRSTRS